MAQNIVETYGIKEVHSSTDGEYNIIKISLYKLQKALRNAGKGKKDFTPILIGSADFANGTKFHIHQINKRGGCRITNLMASQPVSYAHNLGNAWANIRYQARITYKNQRSS